jgi:hypothetical protein
MGRLTPEQEHALESWIKAFEALKAIKGGEGEAIKNEAAAQKTN